MNKQDLNKSYYNGVREGITQYAWWRDGVQYVGTCGETLAQALKNIDAEEARALEILEQHNEI